jgi:hypothetical protein
MTARSAMPDIIATEVVAHAIEVPLAPKEQRGHVD